MTQKTLEINGVQFLLNICYENRSDSRASIRKKSINIRIPLSLSREEQFRQLLEMKAWAMRKIQQDPERFRPEPKREYSDWQILKVGDMDYRLRISHADKQSSSARVAGDMIHLSISSNLSKEDHNKHVSTLLSRCVASKRLPDLKKKISELNDKHFNQEIKKIFFKNNKSNWGSCSKAGNINISTRLLFAPDDILEYVCIHELAHLIEPNHSDRFWALVQAALPDYADKIQWLKDNWSACAF
ncbi:MAG: M48 family metallopeptidase [Candidatus Woesearchaeota archaeon]